MALQVEHRFPVESPIDTVWAYFSDPPAVVPCLPGAELVEILEERRYLGVVGLRIGQIAVQFKGTAEIAEVDSASHRMTVTVAGDQQGMVGRAEASIQFALIPLNETSTEVHIVADVGISGKLAQVGGGMIQSVAKFMFERFAQCVQKAVVGV